jgi:AraC-like DNA-binding protein
VYILNGYGKRIIGDSIDYYAQDDLVLLGPSLPHVWFSDKKYSSKSKNDWVEAIVIYIHPDWLVKYVFSGIDDDKLNQLIEDTRRGINITKEAKDEIIKLIYKIKKSSGLKRTIYLLSILDILRNQSNYRLIASKGFDSTSVKKHTKRIETVYQFIVKNFNHEVRLEDVANLANMTPTSFCKYFKSHTDRTFSKFLNEIRIEHACQLLKEKRYNISQIYPKCGFNNFSNFNRSFKKLKHMSPSEYRNQYSKRLDN